MKRLTVSLSDDLMDALEAFQETSEYATKQEMMHVIITKGYYALINAGKPHDETDEVIVRRALSRSETEALLKESVLGQVENFIQLAPSSMLLRYYQYETTCFEEAADIPPDVREVFINGLLQDMRFKMIYLMSIFGDERISSIDLNFLLRTSETHPLYEVLNALEQQHIRILPEEDARIKWLLKMHGKWTINKLKEA